MRFFMRTVSGIMLLLSLSAPAWPGEDSWGDLGALAPEIWCPNCEMWEPMDIENPPRVRDGKLELYLIPMNRWESTPLDEIKLEVRGGLAFIYSQKFCSPQNPKGLAARNVPFESLPAEVKRRRGS